MIARLIAAVALAAAALATAGCSGEPCPKGEQLGIISEYWVPAITYPGHEEQVGSGKYAEEEWVPGWSVAGHFAYIWGCVRPLRNCNHQDSLCQP